MTEPEYHYVRGQGWVVGPAVTTLTIEYIVKGTNILRRVVCEERTPATGERAWWWFTDDYDKGQEFFLNDVIHATGFRESGFAVGTREVLPGWPWDSIFGRSGRRTFTIITYRLRGNDWVLET